jgi:UDP-N-acetylmuramyl pentapeptide phosphotransferase/UDP-N-acetylglucosamine-1-phosphate transferase
MKKYLSLLFISIILIMPFSAVLAINLLDGLESGAQGADYGPVTESTIPQTIGQIVRIMLSFVGAIFFILIIISGVQWMTAGGNEDKVTKARTRLINAAIGLAITVAAYFITWFISTTLIG